MLGSYEYTDMNHAIDIPDDDWDEYVENLSHWKIQVKPVHLKHCKNF